MFKPLPAPLFTLSALLEIRYQPFYGLLVRFIDESRLPQVTFPFRGFLCQNMTAKGFISNNLSRTRGLKSFGSATIGFHLRHF